MKNLFQQIQCVEKMISSPSIKAIKAETGYIVDVDFGEGNKIKMFVII